MARAESHQGGKQSIPLTIEDAENYTPSSTLDPDAYNEPDRQLGIAHGTDALGPSDTSDSGSDIHGEAGFSQEIGIEGLQTGTTSDPDTSTAGYTAGPDIGDTNLDSDSDANGTGERAAAGRDTSVSDGQDIGTDRVDFIGEVDNEANDDDKTPALSNGRHRR